MVVQELFPPVLVTGWRREKSQLRRDTRRITAVPNGFKDLLLLGGIKCHEEFVESGRDWLNITSKDLERNLNLIALDRRRVDESDLSNALGDRFRCVG